MNNDLNTLVLRLYDLAQQASTEEFSQQILREIRPVIAFDSAAIYSLTLFRDRTIRFVSKPSAVRLWTSRAVCAAATDW